MTLIVLRKRKDSFKTPNWIQNILLYYRLYILLYYLINLEADICDALTKI